MPDPTIVELKVAEAQPDDVNKGIVRIDSSIMRKIGVTAGDFIEIEGERRTVGIVDRAYPGDIGLAIIRIDGLIRRNAKTTIGETVKVKKAELTEAKKVIISPAREGIQLNITNEILKRGLLGRAVFKGDIVSLGGTRSRRNALTGNPFFDDIFRLLDDDVTGFGFSDIKLIIAGATPKGPVVISESTEVQYNPDVADLSEEEAVPDVTYEDIGGLREEIKKIREMVELPLKHPEIFERLGIEPPKGVLLHGPPGTGKTLLAKAVANETNSHFLVINGPEIMSKFYGQSEENLRKIFEEAEQNAPAIIFIDEIDAIAIKREEVKGEVERRVVAQLLSLLDGLKSRGKVVVIAATNIPNMIDPALRRPGRFDRELEINVPNKEGRGNILKIHTRFMPIKGSLYPDIYASTIKKKITEKQKQLLKEKSKLENNKAKLEEELFPLKEKLNTDSFLESIKNRITSLNDKISNLETKIDEKQEEIGESNKLQELLSENAKDLDELYDTVKIFEHSGLFEADDPRTHFRNYYRDKSNSKISEICDLLIGLNLFSHSVFLEVRQSGIERDIDSIASSTYGFVGADLASLTKESAMIVLRKSMPDLQHDKEEAIPQNHLDKMVVEKKDFMEALKTVRPSAMREVWVDLTSIEWNDVGGLEDTKQELKEAVEWPLKNPDAFDRLGVKPPKGILLYGPPGTGKTLLAKAVAHESQANFILVKGPELLSKWVGESEKAVRKIFHKARLTSPSVIFFDEIDSIAPRRGASQDNQVTERVVNQILTEMDGLITLNDVVVIAATNRPDIIDPALMRPGRFDRVVMVAAGDEKTRHTIFKVHTKKMSLADDVDLKVLAKQTDGYVGADIESICREAAILALRENMDATVVTQENFKKALAKVPPSVSREIEQSYREMRDQFKKGQGKEMQREKQIYFG